MQHLYHGKASRSFVREPYGRRVVAASVIVLSRRDVAALLDQASCIAAVEEAFRLHAAGRTLAPALLSVHARDGGFHVKAAGLAADRRTYFAAKTNANFPGNPERHGLPTIQ